MTKYRIEADVIMKHTFTVYAVSKEEAIRQVKNEEVDATSIEQITSPVPIDVVIDKDEE